MDLSLLLAQTQAAVEIAKFIKNSSDTLDKSEQKLKLAELIEALADVKIETAEIKSMLLEKDERIQSLENQLKLNNDLVYEAPFYWINNIENDREGPFCQKCYDENQKLIRLQAIENNDVWDCFSCRSSFLYESGIRIMSR